jgi:hypothetical protein
VARSRHLPGGAGGSISRRHERSRRLGSEGGSEGGARSAQRLFSGQRGEVSPGTRGLGWPGPLSGLLGFTRGLSNLWAPEWVWECSAPVGADRALWGGVVGLGTTRSVSLALLARRWLLHSWLGLQGSFPSLAPTVCPLMQHAACRGWGWGLLPWHGSCGRGSGATGCRAGRVDEICLPQLVLLTSSQELLGVAGLGLHVGVRARLPVL